MKNHLLMSITTILLLLQCLTLNAATITVDGTDGAIDNSDGVCSISEAIINANNNNQTHTDCTAGTILDTINLTVDVTLTTVIDNDTSSNGKGRTGTPVITSGIILDGQGHTLQRDNTLTCNLNNAADVGEFRLLRTTVTAGLILQNITLAHGCADSNFTNPDSLGRSGAGIYNAGDLVIKKVTFDQNKSRAYGGALYHETGTINEISNSTFSGNSTRLGGGAIYKKRGNIDTISNSTFSGNSTFINGAAIDNAVDGRISIITNCTFSENSVTIIGGGIAAIRNDGIIQTIRNSLFHNNNSNECNDVSSTLLDNNISTRIEPIGCSPSGPLLTASSVGPLADNGGPTLTHALLQGSEAIDGGGVAATATDQRSFAADGVRDIGAYEAQIPVVTAPGGLMFEATGATTAVTLGTATVTDADETGVNAVADLSGPFALGVHTVTWTATDSQGHEGTDTQTVTIVDTTPPTVTAPADIIIEATGTNTSVTLGMANANDLVDGTVSPVTANNTGPFTLGTHSITWSATDTAGNTGTATQTITITDTTAPTVIPPTDITIEATGAMTPVTLGSATATDLVDGAIIPTANMSSPFAVGIHNITWSATDNAGNIGTATQSITITDTTAPIVTPPSDIIIEATGTLTTVTLGSATAVDLVDGNLNPTADRASPFTLAMHTVMWSATDTAGNTGSANQLVNVQAVISGAINGLNGSLTIQNSGGDNLVLTADGNFRFATALDNLSPYSITVLNQPASQFCIVSSANGQVTGNNISDILIDCADLILSLNTVSLDFGGIFIGANKTQDIIINNTSSGAITINQITNPSLPFTVISSSCSALPFTLNPGDNCQLIVSFEPTFLGNFNSSIDIISDATSSPNQITLSGNAIPQIIPILNIYGLIILILLMLFLSLKMNLLHYPKR